MEWVNNYSGRIKNSKIIMLLCHGILINSKPTFKETTIV